MEENGNFKKAFVFAAYAALIFSGIFKFVIIDNQVSVTTFEVKGFLIVFGFFIPLIYAISTKKKPIMYIAYLIIFGGYIYSFYSLHSIYDDTVKLDMGFYIYCLSAIITLISLFIPSLSNNKVVRTTEENKDLEDNILKKVSNQANNYIFGKYLYGITDKTEYSSHRCALATMPNSSNLIVILMADNTAKFEINYTQIEKISVKRSLAIHKRDEDPNKNNIEDRAISYALGGSLGLIVSDNADNRDAMGKENYEESYIAEIMYKENGISKKAVIILDKNPDNFFQVFDKLYEKA